MNKTISYGEKPLYVAEISANHLGNFGRAKKLVEAAINAGASAVKLQTYTADTMTLDIDTTDFRISENHALWGGKNLYHLYEEAATPWEWHSELFDICRQAGVIPFSSPFDETAVDFLESLDVPIYKIASMETGDIPLIRKIAQTGKPIIMSTGATEWSEIETAVRCIKEHSSAELTLLLCTSAYPASPTDVHLNRMKTLRDYFGVSVGLSDHTLGIGVSVAAIGLGAMVIEKHLTLSRSDGGADGAFSMEPDEFRSLVESGDQAFEALGNPEWKMQKSETESRRLRRSLIVTKKISKGEVLTKEHVKSLRPNIGGNPIDLPGMIGKRSKFDLEIGAPIDTTKVIN